MTKTVQLLEMRLHAVSIALALAIVLVPAVVGTSAQAQTFTVLYSFTGGTDGGYPMAGLIRDTQGNLYGTTESAGDLSCGNNAGCGVVFEVDTTGKETVLHSFAGEPDGAVPVAGLLLDAKGNLYGTTFDGGTGGCSHAFYVPGCGTVFKVDKAGKETVLFRFKGKDGAHPAGVLVGDAAGNLYGTTTNGGGAGLGTVFKLDKSDKETVLHRFESKQQQEGLHPYAGLVRASTGNLYGTTVKGGPDNCYPNKWCGVVFMLDPTGKETLLYSFSDTDGETPWAGLVRDAKGNLYGTTSYAGPYNEGTVFKLDKQGNLTILHSFKENPDGALPLAGLILDANGNLYGTTYYGGTHDSGTVFKIDSAGNETVLYSFTGGNDGGSPLADLLLDTEGNLYGTTWVGGAYGAGVVFKLTP